jgi:hypothetical protein
MAAVRFLPILKMHYFSSNEEQTEAYGLQKVQAVFNKFLSVFHDNFIPSQDHSVEESSTLFKRR